MKKIAICVVLLICLGAGSLFAQDVLSWPEPISPVHPIINVGVGFGGAWMYLGMGIPPLSATVDFPLNVGIPLSVGGGATFASFGGLVNALYINGRVALHFNFGVRGLDIYPVLSLGPAILWWNAETLFGYTIHEAYSTVGFGFGTAAGLRYFFNDNIGIWTEVGYATLSYISAGVTFTFGGGGGGSGSSSGRYVVNADSLNVRSGPSADTALVGSLPRGTAVQVLDSSGTWWRIRAGSITGYVNSSYLARN
jgi:uncharacterized protein YgiM (DUF1202 family)